MAVKLNQPLASVEIDHAKVVSFKVEDNVEAWVKIWVCLYYKDAEGTLIQYVHPQTGEGAFEFKIENANHPLVPGTMLGKCDTCGRWHRLVSGTCLAEGCEGDIKPYDGMTRMVITSSYQGPPLSRRDDTKIALYDFLTTEEVPDPDTWNEEAQGWDSTRLLLDGVEE